MYNEANANLPAESCSQEHPMGRFKDGEELERVQCSRGIENV
jgi:hypothetical protein